MEELRFDAIIHLTGEQVIPNCMAIRLSDCHRHVFLSTAKTRRTIRLLKDFFAATSERQIEEREFPSSDYKDMVAAAKTLTAEFQGRHVGVNVTGGTKQMFAAVLDMCREADYHPFYVDTENRQVQFLEAPFARFKMPPVFNTVSDFVKLAGYEVNNEGKTPLEAVSIPERTFLRMAWKHRDLMQMVVGDFARVGEKGLSGSRRQEVYDQAKSRFESLVRMKADRAMLYEQWRVCEREQGWQRSAEFMGGVWLERWLIKTFSESKQASQFLDLRTGLTVRAPQSLNATRDVQELDMVLTDGYELYVFECKSGKVKQEYVQKLENISRGLGGTFGHGILCSLNKPDEVLRERISLGAISSVSQEALESLPKNIWQIKARKCYTSGQDFR